MAGASGGRTGRPELTAREEDDVTRARQISEWRRQARSYQWIADQLGISKQRAWQIHQATLKAIITPEVDALRKEATERYEGLMVELRELAARVAATDNPDVNQIRLLLAEIGKNQEALRKLHGLDAPAKVEMNASVVVRHEVIGIDMDKL